MATIIEKTIGTGGDYATVAAWIAAIPTDLVAADQVWRGLLLNQEHLATGSSGFGTISGKTCDATRYIELTTATGASFTEHANRSTNPLRYDATKGAALKFTGTSGLGLSIQVPYFRMSKIQMLGTDTSASAPSLLGLSGASTTNVVISQCLFESSSAVSAGVMSISLTGGTIKNSAVIQKRASSTAVIATVSNGAAAYNCTFVSLGATLNYGLKSQSAVSSLKNCYIGGVTLPEDGNTDYTKTNCYTSAAASNYTTAAFSTANFENVTAGTHDLRLVAGSALIDVGASDPTNAPTDIIGTSRPYGSSYDIGAWEYVVNGVVISCTVGASAADGSIATLFQSVTIITSVGNASADGVLAGVSNISQFITDVLINNTGTPLANQAVVWTWIPSGRIGAVEGITVQDGTGTTNGSGRLSVAGLTQGAGILLVAILNNDATDDYVYYEAGTVA